MAKGPGRSYRRDISLPELFKRFPDDEAADQWLVRIRWPNGICCPREDCGSDNVQIGTTHHSMPYRCRSCRKFFSVKTGTVMANWKLGAQIWVLALYLLNTRIKGVSSMKLHRDLGITQMSDWHLIHRIREVWNDINELPEFWGPVQADETWIGGLDKNRHKSKRHGRDWRKKRTPVVGVFDERTREVSAQVVEQVEARSVVGAVRARIRAPFTLVVSDESPAYNAFIRHEWVNHSIGQYVNDMATTNGIESFWAVFKRGYHGTYHWFSHKHAQRYVKEFAGRQNWRAMDTEEMLEASVRPMVGKRLAYAELIA
ncbi:MAG: IS1595 family transposase [Chloroflexi bacterium]|nr:IS1595 family transposase [Chloroflexota bacterium]